MLGSVKHAAPLSHNPRDEHRHGEEYEDRKNAPTVQKFNAEESAKRDEAVRQAAIAREKGLSRVVRDPITGGQVQVLDSEGDHRHETDHDKQTITVPRLNVLFAKGDPVLSDSKFETEGIFLSELKDDPNSDQKLSSFGKFLQSKDLLSTQSSEAVEHNHAHRQEDVVEQVERERCHADHSRSHAHDEDGWVDLPMRNQRTNVMFYSLPDPDFDTHHNTLTELYMKLPLFIFCCEIFRYFVIDFGRLTAIFFYIGAGYWIKEQMDHSWRAMKLDTVKRRGEQALAKRVPESVEWLNTLVHAIWKQINPDVLTAFADKLEDIMQASAPSIVHGIKIADLGHGDHPVRLLNMRYLSDEEVEADTDSNTSDQHSGDFVNMEVSVAYSATPDLSATASKVKNMHILIFFYSGLANVFAVPIPVWVEMIGFMATFRLRMQFTPEFPFLKNTTFSLMGLPKFEISVVPLVHNLFNVSNLPIISTFVQTSIAAACNEYVAPKSYTIDIGQIIAGDETVRESIAIGIVVLHIDCVIDLEATDSGGTSDPYVIVALSNYARPIFSTRIIEKSLNPIFRETCFIPITPEALRSNERLSLQLWDSDRVSADDENGRIEFDLQDLIRGGPHVQTREDPLVNSKNGSPMAGTIHWSLGYYSKRQCNEKLATDGSDSNLHEEIKHHPDMEGKTGLPHPIPGRAVSYCPPDPEWPSGILRVQIHHASDLYAETLKSSWKPDMHYKKGQETDNPRVEEDEDLSPSAYCTIILNDHLIYKTRTKAFSSQPYFNAGTEHFLRDWRTAVCMIALRDSRTREHDALLGVIPLKLSEVFKNASQVCKNFPLVGGVGEGKVRISLLWESIDYKLHKSLLGWEIGNFRFTSEQIKAVQLTEEGRHLKNMKLRMHTSLSSSAISGRHSHHENNAVVWKTAQPDNSHLELPVKDRHSSALCIEFHSKLQRHSHAMAVLWLTEMTDNETHTVSIPIWRTDSTEKRSFISQCRFTGKDPPGSPRLEQIGTLVFDAVLYRGLSSSHDKRISTDTNLRQAHECWSATIIHKHRKRSDTFLVGHQDGHTEKDTNTNVRKRSREAVDREGQRITDDTTKWAISEDKRSTNPNGTPRSTRPTSRISFDRSGSRDPNDSDSTITTIITTTIPPTENRGKASTQIIPVPLRDPKPSAESQSQSSRPSSPLSWVPSSNTSSSSITSHSHAHSEPSSHARRQSRHEKQREKEMSRYEEGALRYRPFRTLKWAKDGVLLGTAKVRDKFRDDRRKPTLMQ